MGNDETIFGPMIRDMVRLSVIRYGDTKRDTLFGLPDTSVSGDVRKAARHESLSLSSVNLNT
jgi:hypothetical protein